MEFHQKGADFNERLFMAGNQLGKTLAGGAEYAYHLTGEYPDWWKGLRFDNPPLLWATGVTSETTRDNPQRVLLGPPAMEEEWGDRPYPWRQYFEYNQGVRNHKPDGQHPGKACERYVPSYIQGLRERAGEVAGTNH